VSDIFLSYASDDRERVRPLVEHLQAQGWSVWWDRQIRPGPSYHIEISKAIDAARCVVVVWSRHSVESEWVINEANEGLERDVLVPLMIDDVRVPLAFRSRQAADLTRWSGEEDAAGLSLVIEAIGGMVGEGDTGAERVDRRLDLLGASMLFERSLDTASPHGVPAHKSIAVLPLVNMSSDPEQEYFSDGIAEELLNGLAKVAGLRVVSRAASFLFKGQRVDPKTIGHELNVEYILDGSVRKAGERIRITAQLVHAADGSQVWSENYDGDLGDIFELQDRVAEAVVAALKLRLETPRRAPIVDVGTSNPKAYDEWLLAQYQSNRNTVEGDAKAIRHLEQAIDLDDGFVAAHLRSAAVHMRRSQFFGAAALADMRARATPLIEKAKALDPDRQAQGRGWDWVDEFECPNEESKERMYRERIKDPRHPGNRGNQAWAFEGYARILTNGGFFRSARNYHQQAVDRDPDNIAIINSLAASYGDLGERDVAVEIQERALAIEPYHNHLRANWLAHLIHAGRLEEAAAYLHRKERAPDNNLEFELLLAQGEHEAAAEVLDLIVKSDLAGPAVKLRCLLMMGELDQAFDWALKAHEYDDYNVKAIRRYVQRLSSVELRQRIANHPRYQDLLEKMGIGPAWKEELARRAATLTPITGIDVAEL
jgi:TolB-like protein/Tfp pilus assembly protein PilF